MRFDTLGKPRLTVAERTVGPDHEVVFALALVLCEAAPKPVLRSAVCDLLWPDVPRERAQHNLRQATYKLKQMGGALVATDDALALPPGATWDVAERLADGAPPDGELPWVFLEGYDPRLNARFVAFIERWRDRVHQKLAERLLQALRQARARTQWLRATGYAQLVLALDPLNEEATLTLAEGRALQGSKAEAVGLLDRYLEAIEGLPGELAIQPTLLKRRITQRLPNVLRDKPGWKALVGRDELMEGLTARMRDAREGRSPVVALWGEPGVGKTRLVREMTAFGAVDGWSCVTVSCEPTWPERPLVALEVLVGDLLQLPGALGVEPRAHRALQRLVKMDPDDEPLPQGAEDGAYRQRLLRSSVVDLVEAVSQERPLLVCVDEAQWADPASLPFIALAVEQTPARRVAWVFTSSTREELPRLATGGRATVTRVPPLTTAQAFELLRTLVAGQPPADDEAHLMRAARVSSGNPLYVHTLATHWLSTGDTSVLPPSLEALIEERLDQQEPRAMRCLQVCALLARHATPERVEAVLQEPRPVLLGALDALHSAGLLETVGTSPQVRHEIIAARSVGRASPAAVVLMHRYIAEVLEPDAQQGEDPLLLVACAEHWRRAGQVARGVSLIDSTGRHLLARGDFGATAAIVDAITEQADELDPGIVQAGDRLALELSFARGDTQSAVALAERILSRKSEGDDGLRREAEIALLWGRKLGASSVLASQHSLVPLIRSAEPTSPLFPRLVAEALSYADLGFSARTLGEAVKRVNKQTERPNEDWQWNLLRLQCAFYERDLTTALRQEDRLRERSTRLQSPYALTRALSARAMVHRCLTGRRDSTALLLEAAEVSTGASIPALELGARLTLAHHLMDVGDLTAAAGLLAVCRDLQLAAPGSPIALIAFAEVRLAFAGGKPDLDRAWSDSSAAITDRRRMSARFCAFALAVEFAHSVIAKNVEPLRAQHLELVRIAVRASRWPRTDWITTVAVAATEHLSGPFAAMRLAQCCMRHRFDLTDLASDAKQVPQIADAWRTRAHPR